MNEDDQQVYAKLERLFHEPSRLAILSLLIREKDGVPFKDIKTTCGLTDGNLNRHLKTLEEAGVVKIKKQFVKSKPRTTVRVSAAGRQQFLHYLKALEEVLLKAARAAGVEESETGVGLHWGDTAGA
jgi:DNA-binding transcriptional ArsR family regulator